MIGLALDCTINENVFFSRKAYFYPDLSKNYQITQYEIPLAERAATCTIGDTKIRIRRVHIEEDPGEAGIQERRHNERRQRAHGLQQGRRAAGRDSHRAGLQDPEAGEAVHGEALVHTRIPRRLRPEEGDVAEDRRQHIDQRRREGRDKEHNRFRERGEGAQLRDSEAERHSEDGRRDPEGDKALRCRHKDHHRAQEEGVRGGLRLHLRPGPADDNARARISSRIIKRDDAGAAGPEGSKAGEGLQDNRILRRTS